MSIWTRMPEAEIIANNLRKNGLSWTDIAIKLSTKYGKEFTANQIRKRLKRVSRDLQEEAVGVISDIHIPLNMPNMLDVIENNFRGKIDTLIIVGDLLDCYSLSKFPKRKNLLMREELTTAHYILEVLTSWFNNVILIKGNHDERFQRYIIDKVSPDTLFLVNTNILDRFIYGFDIKDYITGNTTYFPPIKGLTVINNWWYKYNDVMFAHPFNFFKTEMQTVVKTHDYFVNLGEKYKSIFIGHTHHAGIVVKDNDTLLIEGGCMCQDMEYAEGNIRMRPQQRAITFMNFNNGSLVSVKQTLLDKEGNTLTGLDI